MNIRSSSGTPGSGSPDPITLGSSSFGRQAERDRMVEAAEARARGEVDGPSCFVLSGPEGVGKRWLVDRVQDALADDLCPYSLVEVDLGTIREGAPDLPLADACATLAERLGTEIPQVEAMLAALGLESGVVPLEVVAAEAHLLSGLQALLDGPPWEETGDESSVPGGEGSGRYRLGLQRLRALVTRARHEQPLLLVITHGERLKEPLTSFLRDLAVDASSDGGKLLMVVCSDSSAETPRSTVTGLAADGLQEALAPHGLADEIRLKPLSEHDLGATLARRFPSTSFPEDFVHDVHALTLGMPRRVEELLQQLQADGVLEETAEGAWRLDRDEASSQWFGHSAFEAALAGTVPEGMDLEAWTTAVERVLGAGALVGPIFPWEPVVRALELDEDLADLVADFLDDHSSGPDGLLELLNAHDGPFPGWISYRFSTPFARRACEGRGAVGALRQRLLPRLASAMEEAFGDTADPRQARLVAELWQARGDDDRALPWLRRCHEELTAEHLAAWLERLDTPPWSQSEALALFERLIEIVERDEGSRVDLAKRENALLLADRVAHLAGLVGYKWRILLHQSRAELHGGSLQSARASAIDALAAMPDEGEEAARALLLLDTGTMDLLLGRFDEALSCYQESLAIREAVLGRDHPSNAATLHAIGQALFSVGQYDEALEYYQRALVFRVEALGSDHRLTATTLFELGQTLHVQGRYDEALGQLERAHEIAEHVHGAEHPTTASTLDALGRTLHALGRFDDALSCHGRALAINEAAFGEGHPSTALSLGSMGRTLVSMGRYDEALSFHGRALAINQGAYGREHPSTAVALHDTGEALRLLGRTDEAAAHLQEALAIKLKTLGKEHPSTVVTSRALAGVMDSNEPASTGK